jgi:hypothetical protein
LRDGTSGGGVLTSSATTRRFSSPPVTVGGLCFAPRYLTPTTKKLNFAPESSYLNRFESLESLEFSAFFCGAHDRNMIRFGYLIREDGWSSALVRNQSGA